MLQRKTMNHTTWPEFAGLYGERQSCEPARLLEILHRQRQALQPDGWMLLEGVVMDSSWLGRRAILPYGGRATYGTPPDHGMTISPHGTPSTLSACIAVLRAEDLPETTPSKLPTHTQETQ